MPLKDIAEQLGVSPEQVRKWKHQDKWCAGKASGAGSASGEEPGNGKVTLPKAERKNEQKAELKAEQRTEIKSNVTNKKRATKSFNNKEEDQLSTFEELMQRLTPKRQLFVMEYLRDEEFNATQAAIRSGFSKKTAYSQGQRLLKNVEVKAAIDAAMAARLERLKMSQDETLLEISKLARAKITDYLSFRTEKTIVDCDGNGTPIYDYKQIVEVKPSDEVDGAAIAEVQLTKDGTFKFKLHDKKGSLELMGRHQGLFKDKHEHTGKDGGPIEISKKPDLSSLTDEELDELERILSKATQDTGTEPD